MNKYILFFTVAGSFALLAKTACADDAALPGEGYAASHYETLWTKSPFSVATPDTVEASPDYTVAGITQLEGIAYASVVDSHSGAHFLISSEKANKEGLKLVAITRSHNSPDTYVSVQKDGQPLTLKLQSAPATPPTPGANPNEPPIMVPPVTQNIQMPGGNNPSPVPGFVPGSPFGAGQASPRPIRIHRPTIHLPPMPAPGENQPAPQGAPGAPPTADSPSGQQPVQTHVVPPSQ